MVEYSDLYGFFSDDLDELASIIGSSLGITFSSHESLYHGGDYYLWEDEITSESFRLQSNRDLLESAPEDAWAEPEFRQYPSLLYVSGTVRPAEIEKAILETLKEGAAILQRETLNEDSAENQS